MTFGLSVLPFVRLFIIYCHDLVQANLNQLFLTNICLSIFNLPMKEFGYLGHFIQVYLILEHIQELIDSLKRCHVVLVYQFV